MARNNETLAEIIGEARKENCYTTPWFVCYHEDGGVDISELLDRIEAAHRREVAELKRRMQVLEDVLIPVMNCDSELQECIRRMMEAMCNYCRSTPEAKGLPCMNGCEMMLAAKRLSEDGQREQQQDNENNNKKGTEK